MVLGRRAERSPRARRPRAVVVLMVVAGIQAALLLFLGAALWAAAYTGVDGDPLALAVAGAVVVAIGLVQVALVVMLSRGSELARSTFGVVAVLQTAGGVYSAVALREFGAVALLPTAVSIGVLWLLYGSTTTRDFFTA